jgi:hypothetical protein
VLLSTIEVENLKVKYLVYISGNESMLCKNYKPRRLLILYKTIVKVRPRNKTSKLYVNYRNLVI